MKYILVTGGVISGVGKGVIASSFGTLLKSCGLDVTSIKIDPYINIDAGTFSPYEHEVVLKAKWKGLRDNFRVEYKRIPRSDNGDFLLDPATFESKWIHYYALLFLTEHMRHRMPKNEQDASSSSFYYPQQSQECEKTIIEPDLTNGLIRIPDSDEEFDEDDVEDEDDDVDDEEDVDNDNALASASHKTNVAASNIESPPAAHTQPPLSSSIKLEESSTTRSLLRPLKDLQKQTAEKQAAEDLSKKSATTTISTTAALPISSSTSSSTLSNLTAFTSSTAQHKKRSVSPPPLYNKAHHVATTALTAAALSKERDDYPHPLHNGNSSLHGSHEHLNFTKHSYANGLIPALKLKRPRLSEDSNFNGSSTMDNTSSLVPEDDDYHYLLSLHPYMKQLNAAQKLRIRTKIQKLIFKELYKEDLEETK